jgi:hypothetical protein
MELLSLRRLLRGFRRHVGVKLHIKLVFDLLLKTEPAKLREDAFKELGLIIRQLACGQFEQDRLGLTKVFAGNLRKEE